MCVSCVVCLLPACVSIGCGRRGYTRTRLGPPVAPRGRCRAASTRGAAAHCATSSWSLGTPLPPRCLLPSNSTARPKLGARQGGKHKQGGGYPVVCEFDFGGKSFVDGPAPTTRLPAGHWLPLPCLHTCGSCWVGGSLTWVPSWTTIEIDTTCLPAAPATGSAKHSSNHGRDSTTACPTTPYHTLARRHSFPQGPCPRASNVRCR